MHADIPKYLPKTDSSIFLEITKSKDDEVHIQNGL